MTEILTSSSAGRRPRHRCDPTLYKHANTPIIIKLLLLLLLYRQDAAKRQTAGIKSTHRPKISLISPRRGDSLHRFTSNLAGPTAPGSASLCKISPQSAQGVGMRPPKYQKKNPLFDNESPRRGDPRDRFLNF